MYKNILLPIDNSELSWKAVTVAALLGKAFRSSVACLHVYSAKLHERSFVKLELSLPQRYRDIGQLASQREFHGALIEKSLRAINESYFQKAGEKLRTAGLQCQEKSTEGKNFQVIAE